MGVGLWEANAARNADSQKHSCGLCGEMATAAAARSAVVACGLCGEMADSLYRESPEREAGRVDAVERTEASRSQAFVEREACRG